MRDVSHHRDLYLSAFSRLEKGADRNGAGWFHGIRKAAIARFADLGFPSTRQEEWRHTSVDPIARVPFAPAVEERTAPLAAEDLRPLACGVPDVCRLVIVNGRIDTRLSDLGALPEGVVVKGLAEAIRDDADKVEPHLARHAGLDGHPFASLNTAFLQDGAFVHVPAGVAVKNPLFVLFITTAAESPTVSYPRILVLAERGSEFQLVEGYAGIGAGVYFTNAVTEMVAGEDSVIDHYKLQEEGPEAFHVASTQVLQRRGSSFTSHSISIGGALVRNDLGALLGGEGIDCTLNGLYLTEGRQHVDNHTTIDHAQPHSQSRELYKGILMDRSRAVFNGRVLVRKDAQKTDARQSNKNLLLSGDSLINTKPELEIFADDVKCAHGATIGQIQEDAIFYLRSRGIDTAEAQIILTYAFANEILRSIRLDSIRVRLDAELMTRFRRGHAGKGG